MRQESRAWKYGDNVDTDVIVPARYLTTSNPSELASHCMEDIDPDFASRVAPGDIIVAGENFGCGSSREHAPIAIKTSGVSCVIAASFARIFYRNAINIGLPILECAQAAAEIQDGDSVEVDFESGAIRDLTSGKEFRAMPFPPFVRGIVEAGGLIPYVSAKLCATAREPERTAPSAHPAAEASSHGGVSL
jgi:3-isopropylmalate/(R)-2-methylmalate dehydratase small subunit